MSKIYLIETPESLLTVFGIVKPSERDGFVKICKPSGDPIFEVPATCVKEQTQEQLAELLFQESKRRKLDQN